MNIEEMSIIIHIVFSFLAATGFAVFLNAPKETLFYSGFIGMISWVVYILFRQLNFDIMISNFIGASVASIISEIFAIKFKKPTIIFIIPGIITLIPGLGLYNTMFYMIEGSFDLSIQTGASVMFASGAISLGVVVASSLFRTYYHRILKRIKK
ncbi:MAG: threonine/serine exporter family protein [Peptostreptococcaceae bacterium]